MTTIEVAWKVVDWVAFAVGCTGSIFSLWAIKNSTRRLKQAMEHYEKARLVMLENQKLRRLAKQISDRKGRR